MIKFKERSFSRLSKEDLINIVIPRVISSATDSIINSRGVGGFLGSFINGFTTDVIHKLVNSGLEDIRNNKLASLDNNYLVSVLEKLHYRLNKDYTIGDKKAPITVHMNNGILLITMKKGYSDALVNYFKKTNSQISDIGNFTIISYHPYRDIYLNKDIENMMMIVKKVNIYDQ